MPPKGTKRTMKKPVEDPVVEETVQSTSPVPSESVQTQEEPEQQSWSAQVEEETKKPEEPPKKSCTDFERTEVRGWEMKKVSELSNSDLLKVLMTRGEDTQNPALVVGTRHLLMQLHMERVPRTAGTEEKHYSNRPRHNNRRNYNDFEDRPPRQVVEREIDRMPRVAGEERDEERPPRPQRQGGNREEWANGNRGGNRRWDNDARPSAPRGRGHRVQVF